MTKKPGEILLIACVVALGLACGEKHGSETMKLVIPPASNAAHHSQTTIIAFHGFGSTPEEFAKTFDGFELPAKIVLPRSPILWGIRTSWFSLGVPRGTAKSEAFSRDVAKTAHRVCKFVEENSQHEKSIVTGFSQGGILAYALAVMCPDYIRLSIPIAGFLPVDIPKGKTIPPIIALHGKKDKLVNFARDVETVRLLQARGVQAELRSFRNVSHQITQKMRNELYEILNNNI